MRRTLMASNIDLRLGDCLEVLKKLPENSIDSVVTDPPYGLSFMGKTWDYDVPSVEIWKEVLRVLKPGGHLLSFFGTRTYHRGVVRIEDAGFEIRDQIQWIYGSGFPKSHNLKGEWQGWGTALKPANEPIVVARKPLEKGLTVAENVTKWGTGAINVDGCRIGTETRTYSINGAIKGGNFGNKATQPSEERETVTAQGRWPANVLFDEEAAEMLDEQSGILKGLGQHNQKASSIYGGNHQPSKSENLDRSEQGGASRFFYVAKASKSERNAGLEGMPKIKSQVDLPQAGIKEGNSRGHFTQNFHPTVKPIKLMQYLIKLVTPPNGTVLDPFMGSGSTGVAAKLLNRNFVGIERDESYFNIATKRIDATNQRTG